MRWWEAGIWCTTLVLAYKNLSSPPKIRNALVARDVGLTEATFVEYEHFENDNVCEYEINCPDSTGIQLIKNGHITNHDGLVYDDDLRQHSFGYWFWKRKKIKPVDTPPMSFDRALSFVRVFESFFQHVAIGSFLKARYHCDWIKRNSDVKIIVINDVQKTVLQYACQIDPTRYVMFENGIFAKEMFLIHWITSEGSPQGKFLTLAASPPDVISLPKDVQASVVYYLERKRSIGKRYVTNDRAVIRELKAFSADNGYEFEVFDGDRSKLMNAAYIVGPHGGAFGNIIYGNSKTRVLEFITLKGLKERPCYILSARTMGLSYDYLEPTKGFDFLKGGMEISVPLLRSKLENLKTDLIYLTQG